MKRSLEATLRNAPKLDLEAAPCPDCLSPDGAVVASGVDYEYRSCSNAFRFVCCAKCGLVYLNPRPRIGDFPIIYPADYYSFVKEQPGKRYNPIVQRAWDTLERRRLRLFWELLGHERKTVLDLGCGTGRLLNLLRAYGHSDWRAVGIEMGGTADSGPSDPNAPVIYHGLYEETEFAEAPFDLIVAQQVIEHVPQPRGLLEKVFKELAPGGHAVFDTPDYNGIDRRLFSKSCWGGYHFPRHLTLFTSATFAHLAGSVGFQIVSTRKMVSPVFWALSIHNLLTSLGVPLKWADKIHYQALPVISLTTAIEMLNLLSFRMTSNMRIVLRRSA